MNRDVYQCPVTQRFYDPLEMRRALLIESSFQINEWIEEQKSSDPAVTWPAQAKVVAVTRKVFGLQPIDPITGGGEGDARVIAVLNAFTEWLEGKGGGGQNRDSSPPARSSDFPPSSATKSGCPSC